MNNENLEAVRTLMREKGLSRRAAATELGFSESTVRGWEQQENAHPKSSFDFSDGLVEIPVVQRDYSSEKCHYVYPLGDVHKGSPAHDAAKWREWIAWLGGKPNCSLLGTGDFLNSALKTSVSESYDEILTVGDAKREVRAELKPLAGRIDLLIPGNHEERIYRAVGDCPIQDLADSLEAPYARKVALVVYRVGSVEYLVYVRHGTGGGGVGARANRLEKQANAFHADLYISGHTHNQLVFPSEIFVYDRTEGRIVRRQRYFVSSGSFQRYDDYPAGQGMTPTVVGAPRIRLDGERFDVHVSV